MSADDVLDPGTRRKLASGRRTAGDMFVAVRAKLRRLFLVFVVMVLGTVYLLRIHIWPTLEADLLAQDADIVVLTPFDVILLQAKIGIFVGLLSLIPTFLYYAREPLKSRGLYPEGGVARWKLVGIAGLASLLFVLGVIYSYNIFFPVMFSFLANHALSVDLVPTYSLVDWTQFIFVLALSFGFAAQLPLVMTLLSYSEIIPYETFRDKWKYAVVGMFAFGALFSPPDPFTQLMWALPLVVLYGVSLYISRFAIAFKYNQETTSIRARVRAKWNWLVGGFFISAAGTFWIITRGLSVFNELVIPRLPGSIRPQPVAFDGAFGYSGPTGGAIVALIVGVVVACLVFMYLARPRFDETKTARIGDPSKIDLTTLDAEGIRAAPPEVFLEMDEETSVRLAREAVDVGDPDKAQAILDRYDAATGEGADNGDSEVVEGPLTTTTTGVMNAFSEDERTEEEIGGYFYDIMFIVNSLRSKMFRVFAVFILVLIGVFWFLYQGGIGSIKRDFLNRLPAVVRPEEVSVITLHPVEALVFSVKIATLLGLVATFPLILYYTWPALQERGLASGNRNVFFGWAGAIALAIVGGSALGYSYVAPAVVSYFVWDALQADMVIAYRVSNFFWLIFFTTVGIGLWICIPVTMVLFHRGGIVSYARMREAWRGVTVGVLAAMAAFTPAGVLSMVLVAIPVMLGYGVGLFFLWVYSLGERVSFVLTHHS